MRCLEILLTNINADSLECFLSFWMLAYHLGKSIIFLRGQILFSFFLVILYLLVAITENSSSSNSLNFFFIKQTNKKGSKVKLTMIITTISTKIGMLYSRQMLPLNLPLFLTHPFTLYWYIIILHFAYCHTAESTELNSL